MNSWTPLAWDASSGDSQVVSRPARVKTVSPVTFSFARDVDQHLDLRGGLQDARDDGGTADEMLEVVEHEQLAFVGQVGQQLGLHILIGGQGEAERLGHRLDDVAAGADVGEADEEHPVGEAGHDVSRCLDRQPGLAGAPRRQDRQQAGSVEDPFGLCQFCLPPEELGQLDREVVGDSVERGERREVVRESSDVDLVHALGPVTGSQYDEKAA